MLVIGHFWPYQPRGSKRILGLAKYLPKFGWQPVVISGAFQELPETDYSVIQTPAPHTVEDIKRWIGLNPQRGVQEQVGIPLPMSSQDASITSRLVTLVESVVTYPDPQVRWKPFAIRAACDLIRERHVDCLLSVWPIPAHLAAKCLKQRYGIPWVADFPDLWSETYSYRYGSIRKWLDRKLERRTLRSADKLTTSSGPLTDVMRAMHQRTDVFTIEMGYDPELVNDPPAVVSSRFTITYTGILYGADRNPVKFLAGLQRFLARTDVDRDRVEVRFYGPHAPALDSHLSETAVSDVVRQCGSVSWAECLEKQRESQLLLQLNWENPREKGAYSGKIAEYLAARRPVLCVGGTSGDVMQQLFARTACGRYCLAPDEVDDALYRYYLEYIDKGTIGFPGNLSAIERFSYREMARAFAGVLDAAAVSR